jgi:7-cyano-7-deazaguanine synthase
MKRAILALSGGMDSTSLLLYLIDHGYDVRCYSFFYGQKHQVELERAKKTVEYLQDRDYDIMYQIINLESVFNESSSALINKDVDIPEGHYEEKSMLSSVVENRNAIFAAILYGKALAWANEVKDKIQICLGIHKGDHSIYPDCRKESRDALAEAFRISNWGSENVEYFTPFLDIDKFGILQEARMVCDMGGLDFIYILANTNTCYQPDEQGRSCGRCGSCVERVEAFVKLGIPDPVSYIKGWGMITDDVEKILRSK